MRRLRYTEPAQADLREIRRSSTEQWGAERTRRYMAEISRTTKALRESPFMGRARAEIDAEARSILSGRHVIFYQVHPEFIAVTRVLHGSMDLVARLSADT